VALERQAPPEPTGVLRQWAGHDDPKRLCAKDAGVLVGADGGDLALKIDDPEIHHVWGRRLAGVFEPPRCRRHEHHERRSRLGQRWPPDWQHSISHDATQIGTITA